MGNAIKRRKLRRMEAFNAQKNEVVKQDKIELPNALVDLEVKKVETKKEVPVVKEEVKEEIVEEVFVEEKEEVKEEVKNSKKKKSLQEN